LHKKGLVIGILILLMSVNIGSTFAKDTQPIGSVLFDGNTLYVGGSGQNNYTSIQDAIDDSVDGDTVFVYDDSSPYYEDVKVRNRITLSGENKETTVIQQANNSGFINIQLLADGCIISNFTLIGVYENDGFGISIAEPYNKGNVDHIIKDNIFDHVGTGIRCSGSINNIISDNIFLNEGEGIAIIEYLKQTKITNNIFNGTGIYFASLDEYDSNTISDNTVNDKPLVYFEDQSNKLVNDATGQLILIGCNNITIQNQEIDSTFVGITTYYCENILIEDNSISSCSYGMMIRESEQDCNIKIFNNEIMYCGTGLFIWGAQYCNISNNIIIFNTDGIRLYVSSYYTKVTRNEISDNSDHGIYLFDSLFNEIKFNNFKRNGLPIIGDAGFWVTTRVDRSIWYGNYWNIPRLLPKIIFGRLEKDVGWGYHIYLPMFNIDLNPSLVPNDIEV